MDWMHELTRERGLPWDRRPRLVDLIDVADCWEWQGTRHQMGYGVTIIGKTQFKAHRVVWEALVGPIPEGMTLDHLCRNKACVNPDHLDVVTVAENVMRGESPTARNARKTRCLRGHPYTESNTYRNAKGQRSCLSCKDDRYQRTNPGCDCSNGMCSDCREVRNGGL